MKAGRVWLLLVMLGLLTGPPASSATGPVATPTISLAAPPSPNPPYGIMDVEIEVGDVSDLGAFQMDVVFDPAFIQVDGVDVAPFLGQTGSCDPNLARCAVPLGPMLATGRVRFAAATFGVPAGANGEGVVAVLHLRPTGAGGSTALLIENTVLASVDAVPIVPRTQGATLILWHIAYLPVLLRY